MKFGYTSFYLPRHKHFVYIKKANKPASKNLIWIQGGPGIPAGIVVSGINKLRSISDHFNLILWDPPLVGKSSSFSKPKNFGLQILVEALDEVVEFTNNELDATENIIYGESFGSVIAYLYALKFPNKINHLITSAQVSNARESERLSREYIHKNHPGKLATFMQKNFEKENLLKYYIAKIYILKSKTGYFTPQNHIKTYNLASMFDGFYSLYDYKMLVNPFSFVINLKHDLLDLNLFQQPTPKT